MHPVDALHGNLGILGKGDLLILISNSGENDEVLNLLRAAKGIGAKCVSMTGSPGSTLAKNADLTLNIGVEKEACPLGLAPTASTTAAMAMGDALAVALMNRRNFREKDFAVFHPAGKLGQRLALKVKDIMLTGKKIPIVRSDASLKETLKTMSNVSNLGVALVVDKSGALTGIFTDGDIRRTFLGAAGWRPADPISKYMSSNPKTVEADAPASEALQMMEVKGITSLAIIDADGTPRGVIHLHDILGRGKFTV
jgi:arabinose-5-phosphate isomerase